LALSHVVANVFELPVDYVLLIAALTQAGIVEIRDVPSMPYDDIMDLAYLNAQGAKHVVPKGDRARLWIIKYYHQHRIAAGDRIDNWTTLTREAYDDYCVSKDYDDTLQDLQAPVANRSSSSAAPPWTRDSLPVRQGSDSQMDGCEQL
jgi:hypothetical protein